MYDLSKPILSKKTAWGIALLARMVLPVIIATMHFSGTLTYQHAQVTFSLINEFHFFPKACISSCSSCTDNLTCQLCEVGAFLDPTGICQGF